MTRTLNGKKWTPATAAKALRTLNEDIEQLEGGIEITEGWTEETYKATFGIDKAEGLKNAKTALARKKAMRDEFTRKATAAGLL